MDKNQITGLVLISVLMLVYFYFFAGTPQQPENVEQPQELVQKTPETVIEKTTTLAEETKDTPEKPILNEELGDFNNVLEGEEKEITIETDDVIYTFSTLGGNVTSVTLKEFFTADKQPLILLDKSSSKIYEIIETRNGPLDINQFYFTAEYISTTVNKGDTLDIQFISKIGPGKEVVKMYRIPGASYTLSQNISLKGIKDELLTNQIVLTWNNHIKKIERDLKTSQIKTTINYYTAAGDFDDLSESSSDPEEITIGETVKWISFKQKFFTTAIIGEEPFNGAHLATDPTSVDDKTVKNASIQTNLPLVDFESTNSYYYGPNNYQILKKVSKGFSKNIYLGWTPVNLVNKFLIIPTFNFLDRYISNYGIIIILLVIFIKLLLFPLTYKSYISMAKTKVLKPELDEIKAEFPDDAQKAQAEQMKLYRQVGVNPLSGCIPLVMQMPILFSMFYFFPNSIELRQESFLWATDLSTYDSVLSLPFSIPAYGDHVSLFTILMTLSTILYTWSNNQVSTVQGPMKSMQYMMPVVFMFVLNSFPAALSFYYFVSNLVTFGQQALIRKFVDEDKIKKILDENRKKVSTKKKSKFQLKLEEAMKTKDATKNKRRK